MTKPIWCSTSEYRQNGTIRNTTCFVSPVTDTGSRHP